MASRPLAVRRIWAVLPEGSTRPLRVETDAGRFVLKLVGGPDGPRALAAEWIVAGLARALGVPALELAPLTRAVIEAAIATTPEPWLGPIVFGTAERQRAAYAAYLWKRLAALRARG